MANPNGAPAQYLFKPGNPGGGRPKGIIRKDEVQALLGRMSKKTKAEIVALIANEKATILEITCAQIFLKALESGDAGRMGFLMERMVGKVKDELVVSTPDQDEAESRRFSEEILGDPKVLDAAEAIATKVSQQQLKQDNERRATERAELEDERDPGEAG